jgi:hypothetical protein
MYALAASSPSESDQPRMGNVPVAIRKLDFTFRNGKCKLDRQCSELVYLSRSKRVPYSPCQTCVVAVAKKDFLAFRVGPELKIDIHLFSLRVARQSRKTHHRSSE